MYFYFLGIVLALVTIFGLVHWPTVSENLHLQQFCVWFSSTVRRQLQEYNLFGSQDINNFEDGNEVVDIIEIMVTQAETPSEPQAVDASETIEEIRDIKLGAEEGAAKTQTNEGPTSSTPEAQATESRDSVLSAINASLKRLSSAANSGRINGPELYQILLRETLLHEKNATKNEDVELSSAPSNNTITLDTVTEDESTEPKAKMYFGEAPLEYVPHRE